MSTNFYDPKSPLTKTDRHLPHWEQDKVPIFVTWHQQDSIPYSKLNSWRRERDVWLRGHPKPWNDETSIVYHQTFSKRIEDWLDAGMGSCRLRDPEAARIVAETLHHFHGERYHMHAFVVMPNHVHALFTLSPEWGLPKVLKSWKGYSARMINKREERTGSFWQAENWDRLIRDEGHFARVGRYIRNNPEKAGLPNEEFVVWEEDRRSRLSGR